MIRNVHRASSLSGTVRLPGDKSISHRYAMIASLATGKSEIRGFASSMDCRSTLDCLRTLGVGIAATGGHVTVNGRGLRGLLAPARVLDAGNSGTTMRLLSGILAGQDFESTITGDDSLRRRPMGRVIDPLRLMGASVESQDRGLPPLMIRGGRLKAVRYSVPVASAQVKSCVLLAGLYADGTTAVEEPLPTRDHTEIALRQFGADVRQDGRWILVEPEPALEARQLEVPGDLSGAAFFIVAASILPGSRLLMPRISLNRRRRELLDYLASAGLQVTIENETESAGEPRGNISVGFADAALQKPLPPIHGALAAALIDEIPALSILGSQAAGGLEIADARELRVKESDRIAAVARNLRAMGAEVEERPDGLLIGGGQRLHGADIVTEGDHRIAMAFAVAGLAADGETRIHGAECADVSFPGFFETLTGVAGPGAIA